MHFSHREETNNYNYKCYDERQNLTVGTGHEHKCERCERSQPISTIYIARRRHTNQFTRATRRTSYA